MGRLHEDDPFWALEVMNHFRRLMIDHAERQIASERLPGSALRPEDTLLGKDFDMPDATPEVIRRVAKDLLGSVPAGIEEGNEDELMWRMVSEGQDIVMDAMAQADAHVQALSEADPHIYICVQRDSIRITRVTPHRIHLG